ncbi:FkbM family methyltransferase [Phenylobacterium sp. J367]|uniref:FkbM family methyltransferase n=1 Tax=Phenylobacterium sp. J367 TaxID=2898435 RepID=UPI0021510B8B|nr:FkbM family methyltransferase [Phenylobacterium sp. J367]MCR5879150.1 FkbM family methyltransferase [Phenylobacterium sp. J367]
MIATTEAYGLTFAYPAHDTAVGACLREYGEFSRPGVTLAAQLARGRTFLDVGANIGAFTLPVARSARSVVAIEAHAGLAGLLQRNVEANGLGNVRVVSAAAGAAPGRADFPDPPLESARNFGALSFADAELPRAAVDVVALDEVAPPDTAFVKIDVEGHEREVLRGRPAAARRGAAALAGGVLRSGPDRGVRERRLPRLLVLRPVRDPQGRRRSDGGGATGATSTCSPCRPARRAPVGMVEAKPGDPPPTNTLGFEYLRAFGMSPRGRWRGTGGDRMTVWIVAAAALAAAYLLGAIPTAWLAGRWLKGSTSASTARGRWGPPTRCARWGRGRGLACWRSTSERGSAP